jgi:hypothetical protein
VDDSLELHAFDTIRGSDYLSDQDAVEAFVAEALGEIIRRSIGDARGAERGTAGWRSARSAG